MSREWSSQSGAGCPEETELYLDVLRGEEYALPDSDGLADYEGYVG